MTRACEDDRNCFNIVYNADGSVTLNPAIDPSSENGLECRGDGLWDPDEQVAVFCDVILDAFQAGPFDHTTNTGTIPVLSVLTVTNPSAVMPAQVYWSWYIEDSTINADPGVRGTIVTMEAIAPNALVDVGYHIYSNNYPLASGQSVPGAAQGFADCPTPLAPGASATMGWGFRFEGAGGAGSWDVFVGALHASAMVVTVPN